MKAVSTFTCLSLGPFASGLTPGKIARALDYALFWFPAAAIDGAAAVEIRSLATHPVSYTSARYIAFRMILKSLFFAIAIMLPFDYCRLFAPKLAVAIVALFAWQLLASTVLVARTLCSLVVQICTYPWAGDVFVILEEGRLDLSYVCAYAMFWFVSSMLLGSSGPRIPFFYASAADNVSAVWDGDFGNVLELPGRLCAGAALLVGTGYGVVLLSSVFLARIVVKFLIYISAWPRGWRLFWANPSQGLKVLLISHFSSLISLGVIVWGRLLDYAITRIFDEAVACFGKFIGCVLAIIISIIIIILLLV